MLHFAALAGGRAEVVINEIFYHAQHAQFTAEETAVEFIELHHPATALPGAAIDIGGWAFDNGVSYTFPEGTTIADGGFLVVVADPEAFAAAHPEVAPELVFGAWEGKLSNRGERITLVDSAAVVIDSVHYYDEGEWATKVRDSAAPGWHWQSLADGGRSSLELIDVTMPRDSGKNWSDSTVPGGTPGSANSTARLGSAPFITDVRHWPPVPRSDEAVTISARVLAGRGVPEEVALSFADLSNPGSSLPDPTTVVPEDAAVRVWVPSSDAADTASPNWREAGFNDGSWTAGTMGVGYERSSTGTFLPFIGLDVEAMMANVHPTIYLRIPFELDAIDIGILRLAVRYDDGFVAYINGKEVHRENAPAELSWQTGASASNPDNRAIVAEEFDISGGIRHLRKGENILAIQALNQGSSGSDFLIGASLASIPGAATGEIAMRDDGRAGDLSAGDGIYSAQIPPHASGSVIEFFVRAGSTATGSRFWPGVATSDDTPRALFQVDDTIYGGNQPVYQVVMTPDDYQRHKTLARSSNALINASFISGEEVRYFAGLRFRGNGSRGNNPPNVRIEVPRDRPWKNTNKLNINALFPHLQLLGMRLFQQSGLPTPETKAVQVRFNGEKRNPQASENNGYGTYIHLEPLGEKFVENHLREERGGNVYRSQGNHSSNWAFRGEVPSSYRPGWSKQNNVSEADWTDLIEFHRTVNTLPTAPEYVQLMDELVDLDQWYRWFAMKILINDVETNLSNGADDDYSMFRRPSDGRWILLPHDLDSIFGRGQSGTSTPTATIFQMIGMSRLRPLFDRPELVPRYYTQLDDLLHTVFAPQRFDPMVDTLMDYVPFAERERIKQFMAARRAHVINLLHRPLAITGTGVTGVSTGDGELLLRGTAPLIGTGQVLVNGQVADFNAASGEWTLAVDATPSELLIPRGAGWAYLDDGSDAGTNWRDVNFDHGPWSVGAAPLGYGAGGVSAATTIEGGTEGGERHLTTYFRHEFLLDDPSRFQALTMRVLRDDGVAIFLNGTEVARDQLAADAGFQSPAESAASGADQSRYFEFAIDPALLRPGVNAIAVELHRAEPDPEADLRFDLELEAALGAAAAGDLYLRPGINELRVQLLDPEGNEIDRQTVDVVLDSGGDGPALSGNLAGDLTLEAEAGPHRVSGQLVVPVGMTLTIEPGTSLYFEKGAGLLVRGTLIAAGLPGAKIRFSAPPDAASEPDIHPALPDSLPKWDGIHFEGSANPNNVISQAVIEHAQDPAGSIGVSESQLRVAACRFGGTHLPMIVTERSSLLIEGCSFPDMFAAGERPAALGLDAGSEHIRGVGGIPEGGHYIIRGNRFGTNRGHNAVIDVASNQRPGPILQVLDNVFAGAGHTVLAVGDDVYIAGNVFTKVSKDNSNLDADYASAIITGGGSTGSLVVVARNVFFDVDHALDLRRDDRAIFENNTVVGVHADFNDAAGHPIVGSAINLFVDLADQSGPVAGGGAYAGNNLFVDAPRAFGNADLPGLALTRLEFSHNLVDPQIARSEIGGRELSAIDLGPGNFVAAPAFASPESGGGWFPLRGDSPAIAAGSLGQDLGADLPASILIAGAPAGTTALDSATLRFGGPGMFAFRYRINGGPWSADIAIGRGFGSGRGTERSVSILLARLAPGDYTIEAIGQDYAGAWQDEGAATRSSTWTVQPGFAGVVINEVLASNTGSFADGDGRFPDYIELHNLGAIAVDLAGWALSDDPANPARFVFPAGSSIAPFGYLLVRAAAPVDGGQTGLFSGFGLDATDGDSLRLSRPAAGGLLEQVDAITFGPQLADRSLGRAGDGVEAFALNLPTPGTRNLVARTGSVVDLRLNEWLANPEISLDDDFVEIYNPSSLPVDLSGVMITDDPTLAVRYPIPAHSYVDGRGFVALAGGLGSSARSLPFGLARDCEGLALIGLDGTVIDYVSVRLEIADVSQGRSPDGSDTIELLRIPTPGFNNFAVPPEPVLIGSEELVPLDATWAFDGSGEFPGGDWFQPEFDDAGWARSPGAFDAGNSNQPYPIGHTPQRPFPTFYFRHAFTLGADFADSEFRLAAIIDDGAIIYVNGIEVWRRNLVAGPPGHDDFATANIAGIDERTFAQQDIPLSVLRAGKNVIAASVRQATAGSSDMIFAFSLERLILERTEINPVFARSESLFDHLRISELHYHPENGLREEFVELQNISATQFIELDGVRLSDAISFTFPPTRLAPGEFVLVVEDAAAFEARYGAGLPVAGDYSGRLSNGGERLRLILPAPIDSQILNFRYDDAWHRSTDGGGSSLQVRDVFDERARWGVAAGWLPSPIVGGSPGTANPPANFDQWRTLFGVTDAEGDLNGDGLSHLIEYALGLSPSGSPAEARHSAPDLSFDDPEHPALTFQIAKPPRSDLRYIVERSRDLARWASVASLATSENGGAWDGSLTVVETPGELGTSTRVSLPLGTDDPADFEFFYRLQIEVVTP